MTIRARLLWLTIGLVVPLVLVGFYNLWSAWEISRRQLNESVERQAEFAATAFEQWLEAQKQTLVTIKDLSENNQNPATLNDYLNSIVKTRPHWLDVQIVGADGTIKLSQSAKNRPLPNISIETFRQEIARKNALVIITEQYNEERLHLMSLAQPITGGDFVVARIDGTTASGVFEQLQLPEDNIIAVFDDSNRLLYRNRASPEQMSLEANNTPLLSAVRGKSLASIEVESPYDNVKRVYGLARVEIANCVVAVGVPSGRLYQSAQRQFIYQVFFGLLITALAALGAFLSARSITTPINKLEQTAQAFGAGDLSARTEIKETGIIRRLGETFNQMAEQISERETKLKELDRLKSEFVSSVSHDLRTPLTTIKTLVHVLQKNNISPKEREEFLKTIAFECDRQIDFVQNLLDLSRIESGALKINLAETDIVNVLQSCVESQKQAATIRNVHLKFTKPRAKPPLVETDAGILRRIVSSLLENAIKYTPEKGEIRVSVKKRKAQTLIQISDTGCGVAREDLPFIFDKFYRGRPLQPKNGFGNGNSPVAEIELQTQSGVSGVGLGLYLVKNLVNQIDGEIRVESPSEDGRRGSVFTLILPEKTGI